LHGLIVFIIASKVVTKGNKMLATTYEALMLIKTMVVFFQGALKQSQVCPKCDAKRYVDGLAGIPWKVLQHF
jgi:hypothetical protein